MVRVYDIPAEFFIKRLSEELRKQPEIKPPPWTQFAKTGSHATRMPQKKDWWYVRCASLLRKLYVHGAVGLSDLKSAYGGRKKRGYYNAHHRDAGGAIIRKALQQLESIGYITKAERGRGRALTPDGMKRLDSLAKVIHKELIQILPELKKYA